MPDLLALIDHTLDRLLEEKAQEYPHSDMDKDRDFHITGRMKDMILCCGEDIYLHRAGAFIYAHLSRKMCGSLTCRISAMAKR